MRFVGLALALVMLAVAPVTAQQQPHQLFTKKLFTINRCDAQANVSQTTYTGYVPGYYPYARPWFWGDPYGAAFYQPPVTTTNPQMYVDFVNITPKVMKDIVWGLVANGRLVAEARDVGTFSPGVEIKKKYGISINAFPLQTALPQCIALAVTFADGTHYRNPNLPSERRQMYASPPPGAGPPAAPIPSPLP